jgi:tRNA (cmo5U34)-methyltransferase
MGPQSSESCELDAQRPEPQETVGHFFDRVSGDYDAAILKAIPPYVEMMKSVLGYCFMQPKAPWSVLELGCGTGNLSMYVRDTFPNARLTLVDLSADMLTQAALKLGQTGLPASHLNPVQSGFMELAFEPGQFDLVVSSMALHHLLDEEKPEMYRRIYSWLKPGGLFRSADETLALPEQAQALNLETWESWTRSLGSTTEEIALWAEHSVRHDHYAPLAMHFQWLREAGFTEIDCYWRKLMWTSFGAKKPA